MLVQPILCLSVIAAGACGAKALYISIKFHLDALYL